MFRTFLLGVNEFFFSLDDRKRIFFIMPPFLQMLILLVLLGTVSLSSALENGLAMTPPMGWLAWERCYNLRNTYF